ncbi:DUF294 nucleotidyltransferase-like domain-containing protein [Carboxydocella sp. ULO1]|uniref:DUF294 nucleotidyltransferase-like domain-containing protein n=1 Tax=Carboxydocella sp. ULO1 TaxID=1926599 RepID=UPI0009ACD51F|nr:DUF294 nucleotidyltransferase-like domain-containing protein [Carboxydocella sp. ULO1]GAW29580.1 hypothetical protein ULO1_21500 [Carboxydocella sp. ULO1]
MGYLSILHEAQPFSLLPPEALQAALVKCESRLYPKGTYIFRQGEPSRAVLYILTNGLAEVVLTNEKGEDNVVGLRQPRDFFGETVLFNDKPYPGSVRAVEDCICLLMPREVFESLLENYPKFAGYFTQTLLERMRVIYEEVVAEQSYLAGNLETQPFRKRLSEIMTSPVLTCRANQTVTEVAQLMAERNIGALVVVDGQERPVGIVTDRDLVAKVLAQGCPQTGDITADMVMNTQLVSLPPDAFYSEALLAMVKNKVKYLAVVDQGHLFGIISMRDLIRARSSGALTTVDTIETSRNLDDLVQATREVDQVLVGLLAENAPIEEIFVVMSEFYDRLTAKVIQLAEEEMVQAGLGTPPVPYCFITMGSGGRKEQVLRTDQDNGIIYADVPANLAEEAQNYFLTLGEKIVNGLVACGFARCKGNVMASNPEWTKPLRQWYLDVTSWIAQPVPEIVRKLTIFLDFRPVYGKKELAQDLRHFVHRRVEDYPVLLHFLAKDDLEYKVPLGFFRQFITEKHGEHKNEIDLKRAVCVHMVDCARIFALKWGIDETSTLGRLKIMEQRNIFNPEDSEYYSTAYKILMTLRLKNNLKKLEQGLEADNWINPNQLPKKEAATLRYAMLAVDKLQSFTGTVFHAG